MAVTDPGERDRLAERWVGIALKVARKAAPLHRMDEDEAFEAALFGVVIALNTYDGQCSFEAFVVNRIKHQIGKWREHLRTRKNTHVTYADPHEIHMDVEDERREDCLDASEEVELLRVHLTHRQWDVLHCRVVLGLSVKETAIYLGLSTRNVNYHYAEALSRGRAFSESRCHD